MEWIGCVLWNDWDFFIGMWAISLTLKTMQYLFLNIFTHSIFTHSRPCAEQLKLIHHPLASSKPTMDARFAQFRSHLVRIGDMPYDRGNVCIGGLRLPNSSTQVLIDVYLRYIGTSVCFVAPRMTRSSLSLGSSVGGSAWTALERLSASLCLLPDLCLITNS